MSKEKNIQIRVNDELKQEIKKIAKKENRSVSSYLIHLHKLFTQS